MLLYSKNVLLYGIKVQKLLLFDTKRMLLYSKKVLRYDIKGVAAKQEGVSLCYKRCYCMT